MKAKSGPMTSKVFDLRSEDIIQVPVENCRIVNIQAVPSQMYDRKQKLFKLTVSPLSGPWQNCEGEFVIGSMEDIVVVERYQPPSFFSKLVSKIIRYFDKPKVEALPAPIEHPKWS